MKDLDKNTEWKIGDIKEVLEISSGDTGNPALSTIISPRNPRAFVDRLPVVDEFSLAEKIFAAVVCIAGVFAVASLLAVFLGLLHPYWLMEWIEDITRDWAH
jgi:hypothetical protein